MTAEESGQSGALAPPQMEAPQADASGPTQPSAQRVPLPPADAGAWLQRVHEAQCSRLTPEKRQELQRRAEQSRLRVQQSRRCSTIGANSMRSNTLLYEGLRQMSFSTATEVAGRWRSAQEASVRWQANTLSRLDASMTVAAEVGADEFIDDGEAFQEVSQLMGTVGGSMGAASPAPAGQAQANGGMPRAGEGIEELLQEVRTE